jgi:hypothetical protein
LTDRANVAAKHRRNRSVAEMAHAAGISKVKIGFVGYSGGGIWNRPAEATLFTIETSVDAGDFRRQRSLQIDKDGGLDEPHTRD